MTIIKPTSAEAEIITNFISGDKMKFEKLSAFVSLVLQENEKHNLIGNSTIPQIWTRHIIDSLQLVPYVKDSENITDLGSGAGFPAIVLGIATDKHITMIEKSPVKAEFLKNTCKSLGLSFEVINQAVNQNNIPQILPKNTTITSRAFKSICEIMELLSCCKNINKIVLLKGEKYKEELEELKNKNNTIFNEWNIQNYEVQQSKSKIIIFSKHEM